jgi:hypothetical protein
MRLNPRILLLPFMAVIELFLIAVCLGLAFVNTQWAIALNDWSSKLPGLEWYT